MTHEKKVSKRQFFKPMDHWFYHPFFKYSCAVLLILAILLIFSDVAIYLSPVVSFISILFVPIFISLMLYYLLRPVVNLLENKLKIPRWLGIVSIYLIIAVLMVFFVAYIGPTLIEQMTAFANTSVETVTKMKESAKWIIYQMFKVNVDVQIEQRFFDLVQQITASISKNAVDVLSFLTRTAIILAVIPFIVFYLLKDDKAFSERFMKVIPEDFGKEAKKILHNMDLTFANYIQGLVIVSLCTGGLLFIGYLLIGLNYALILALIALIFMSIPSLGPFLAICPALLVGLSDSPFMVLKVIIVFIIVQQIESNLISPQVIGQRLNIHPLTIILLLLAAGSLYGLIGLILATPLYALSKVFIENVYKIYRLRYEHWKKKNL